MSSEKIPEGQLFTHVYCERGTPLQDSEQFRRRIGKFCKYLTSEYNFKLAEWLEQETGLVIGWVAYERDIIGLFSNAEIKIMLNSITLVWRFLIADIANKYTKLDAQKWYGFVKRALSEENMGYQLDEYCGVHYLIDKEFEINRISAIRCLQDPKYTTVIVAFEDAHRHLDSNPPDTKAAVRSLFESIEILVKQMTNTNRLNKRIVKERLKEIAVGICETDTTAQEVVTHLFDGFAEWVDGMHNYRHGQDSPEPVAPPMDLAVYIFSSGTSFLRWLVEIDKQI